ncbi:ArnT family glycosyltransferase [Nocardia blacklockiae]|uniref:ArnT family glycosyltransferase n=1 Tax=Nocardia blacklockiae TaxID=480036 RepID=UPI001894F87B|nr:glycosyltransferase family 39 protein [Nocardia blacklockiae]MBF6172041.1 glycosyltransferase family 39 protein [Nocardia blacklockiae]
MTTIEAPARRETPPPPSPPDSRRHRHRRASGPPDRPRWARPALLALLLATAFAYLWALSENGWANDYYAAAAQAGTQSWKALLFGSLDAGNAITVDKPPASLWLMGLSGRLLGFSSFSMLLPQALLGVASVGLVYAAVRRWSGPGAGLLAGSVLALTPVAALMFRFNNPDALLVFLLVAAAYCTMRATERGSGRWLALAGAAIGFGFLTKMMQAFLVLPAFALAFLVAAPIGFWQRIGKLLGALLAVVVSAGWYILLVELWPSGSRPYIGGSTDNSLLELALGYNGLGRVLGGSGNGGGGGGGGGNTGFGGSTGISRLFGDSMGTEISWLLPAALIGLLAGLWLTRRTPRTGSTRAALILWGGWLLVTGVVFSFMQGTIHPYYTVALAPAVAALIGVTVTELWRARGGFVPRAVLGGMLAATGVWNFVLLNRTPDWFPALRWAVLIGCVAVALVLVVGAHRLGRLTVVVAAAGLLFGLGGAAAYTVDTVTTAHSGSIPTSGPQTGRGMGGGMGAPVGDGSARPDGDGRFDGTGERPSDNAASEGSPGTTPGTSPQGSAGAASGSTTEGSPGTASGTSSQGSGGTASGTTADASAAGGTAQGSAAGGGMSFGGTASNNAELQALLKDTSNRWAAATVGAQSAGSLELSTGTSIIAIGGFTGSDDAPTLAQFQQYVANGEVRYFIAGGGMGGPGGGSGSASEITAWVQEHFTATTVGGTTVYDLTKPIS